MVTPITYHCGGCPRSYTAENISETTINPDEIKAAVEAVLSEIDRASSNIEKNLEPIKEDAKTAYVMDETKTIVKSIESAYENANNKFSTIKNNIKSEDLYDKAVKKHDELQGEANIKAKQDAIACTASHDKEKSESQG